MCSAKRQEKLVLAVFCLELSESKIANLKSKIIKMPAKDIYHDTVKRALESKTVGRITAENFCQLPWGGTRAFTLILLPMKMFVAEKEGRKIAVEVKSFIGQIEFELNSKKLLGQFRHLPVCDAARRCRNANCFIG